MCGKGGLLMKKTLIISAFVVTFIIGVVLSDLILQGLNGIFGQGTFETKGELSQQLEETREELEKQLKEAQEQYEKLSGEITQREANLNSLIKEIDSQVDPQSIKDVILTTPSDETGNKGRLFLNTGLGDGLLEPTTTDDPMVNEFNRAFNNKAKNIIDVAKDILKEKIGQLNNELLNINDVLKDRNVELIGKLKEIEKFKKEVDRINQELQDRNQQLEVKLNEVEKFKKEVDRINDELKDRNQQLEAKLKEVDKYKRELEDQKKYINDLEGIKSNLQKTVGVLETKIENGRLKVSFKGDILFESGSHELRKEGKDLLESVFSILKDSIRQNDIFIAGHTDNVPIRPDARQRYESNWSLSTYRAIEVVKYLVEKGLAPEYLTAAGYGEFKPVASNDNEIGKAQNRRVELFLIPRFIKRSENN
jgi:chemotaxis protein MotB